MSKDIQSMFSAIAARYDLANDALSFGLHRLWRKRIAGRLAPESGETILDLCTGTGDLAIAISNSATGTANIIALDFVPEMLSRAQGKAKRTNRKIGATISFIRGDAMQIPLARSTVDHVVIAFGIRNVDSPQDCLQEIKRVMRDSGVLTVLEFGQPTFPLFSWLYRLYSKIVIPVVGGVITGRSNAYTYLQTSSAAFPAGKSFEQLLRDSGFEAVSTERLLSGIAYIYSARPKDQET